MTESLLTYTSREISVHSSATHRSSQEHMDTLQKGMTRTDIQWQRQRPQQKRHTDKTDGKKGGTQEYRKDCMEMGWGVYSNTLTWLQVTFTRLGPKPWLAVVAVIELWDEGEVTGDLPVIGNLELLFLQLTELHVLKLELQSKEKLSDIPGQDMAHGQPPPDSAVAPHG